MISAPVRQRLDEILARHRNEDVVWPLISETLLVHLETLFPPRCLGLSEMVEDHLRYAGVASLVEDLRYHFTQQQGPDGGEHSDDEVGIELALRDEE